jgi:inosine-uridine nucleoside N-ribohydrolase
MNKYNFSVQDKKKIRVIIDTDAACEADDQYAIVHSLLTPRFIVKGIIAEQFANQGSDCSVERSYDEIIKLLELMNMKDITVKKGNAFPLESEHDGTLSEGAELIINEALIEDEHPLFVLCQGAITNVAAALINRPEIADRFTCIWIGGGLYPDGCWEFNLINDYHAANVVFKSKLNLWQVPMDCYTTMQVGYAELEAKVYPCGEIGKYLFEELTGHGMTANWVMGESWVLGDSPAPALALNPCCGQYEERNAPICESTGSYTGETNHKIRVYHRIDSRYVLEDFFAKLKLCFGFSVIGN